MGERISYLAGGKLTPKPDVVRVGDTVKTGPNDYPRFKIVAIDSGRAWIRNVASGDDAVVSLEECCWVVTDGDQPDQRIGRMLREPAPTRVGPEAPVEPPRIDRVFPPGESPSPAAERAS